MMEQIAITSFTKEGRWYFLNFSDGSRMKWSSLNMMNWYIDKGKDTSPDGLIRRVLLRIRNSDPTFSNIGDISNVVYEQPEVREVP